MMIACPNTSYLACGGDTGMLSVSRIADGVLLWREDHAHRRAITHLAWSGDGELLASGGQDGRVHVWEAETGDLLFSFLHGERVQRLRWAARGTLLTSSSCAYIRIWPLAAA